MMQRLRLREDPEGVSAIRLFALSFYSALDDRRLTSPDDVALHLDDFLAQWIRE